MRRLNKDPQKKRWIKQNKEIIQKEFELVGKLSKDYKKSNM